MADRDPVTITIKLRLRDKHAAELNRQARAVSFVWNYCNETSRKAWDRDHRQARQDLGIGFIRRIHPSR